MLNTIFMHAGPYRVEDFRDTLARLGALPEVPALGAYQMNHVWAVTLMNSKATKKLLAGTDAKAKNRPCVIIDPNNQDLRLKLHWLLHGVNDDDVRAAACRTGE